MPWLFNLEMTASCKNCKIGKLFFFLVSLLIMSDLTMAANIAFFYDSSNNGNFITEAEGNAGLKFTPATDTITGGNFDIQSSIANNDGGLGGNVVTATITVNPVNDRPSFTAGNPPVIVEDAGAQTITGWVTSFNPGGASDEDGQTVNNYIVENISVPALFSNAPAIDNSGNLTYTSATDAFGTSTFAVKVQDNGGTTNGGVDTSIVKTFTITVNSVNDQPTFTISGNPPVVSENAGSQTITGWVTSHNVGPNITNGDESAQTISYMISNITNSNLFATLPSVNASGDLTYTPANNANGISTFQFSVTDNGGTANGGIDTSSAQEVTITVNPLANMPSVTPANTQEDTMTTSGLVISRHPDDGPEVTHFKITNIQGGTLYHNNGLTLINDGDFITFAQANVGLRFLPAPNSFAQGSFDIQAAQGNTDTDLSGNLQTATIAVSTVADTLTVTNTYTEENVQSSDDLVISRNEVDGAEVTHFKITNIQFGSLYQNDGITPINSDDFITVEQGNAGLKFTPLTIYNGTFDIQASLSADDNDLGGDVIAATINVGLTNDEPKLSLRRKPDELNSQLTWADGDSEPKPITLHLIDDKELENPETVHLKLFNASGEISLGTPAETTLTIIDNEHRLPTIPLSLGLGMGIANEGTLYRAIDLKNLFDTSVIFWGGAKIKGQDYSTTLFSQPSQMIEIVGEIHVDPKHVGKQADILVVASVSK